MSSLINFYDCVGKKELIDFSCSIHLINKSYIHGIIIGSKAFAL